MNFEILFACVLSISAVLFALRSLRRSSVDVLVDLEADTGGGLIEDLSQSKGEQQLRSALAADLNRGFPSPKHRKNFERKVGLTQVATILIVSFSAWMLGANSMALILASGAGIFLSLIIRFRMFSNHSHNFHQELVYYLPIVMERLVMASDAGFDLIASTEKLVSLDIKGRELKKGNRKKEESDPVTHLLALSYRLSEAGWPFEKSLREVSGQIESPALKHAFLHIAQAFKEGGELRKPLRELSDSTQLFYQEIAEEYVATLPVKATGPLLLTFAGLLLMFMVGPVLQVLGILEKAVPQ